MLALLDYTNVGLIKRKGGIRSVRDVAVSYVTSVTYTTCRKSETTWNKVEIQGEVIGKLY